MAVSVRIVRFFRESMESVFEFEPIAKFLGAFPTLSDSKHKNLKKFLMRTYDPHYLISAASVLGCCQALHQCILLKIGVGGSMTQFDESVFKVTWLIIASVPWVLLLFDIIRTTYKTRRVFLKFSSMNFFDWVGAFFAYYLFAGFYILFFILLSVITGSVIALVLVTSITAYLVYRYIVLSSHEGHILEQSIKGKLLALFGNK